MRCISASVAELGNIPYSRISIANGNRTSALDSDGVASVYTFDAQDKLATATTPVGTATYEYWEDGLLKTTRYGTLTETRAYDAASRLTVLEALGVSRFDYTFDGNGNRVRQVETRGGASETTDYGYDEADRLIGVAYPSETQLYGLDGVGNRTGEKRAAPGVVTALTVAAFVALTPSQATAAVERQHNSVDWLTAVVDVKASTTTPLTYDANGNRTTEGTKAFSWDIRDTLTRVQDGATVLGTYDYDAALQRVKADSAQGHVEYVLDGKYVLRETGARTRRYHFSDGEALAVTGVGGGSSQDRWLLIDALGSVVSEANAAGGSVTARQFDAWGNYRNGSAPTANETRLGFTGHQFDVETGFTYARARYYDSKLGIMLSRDSFEGALSDSPSLHRYTYSHNSPLKYRDPSGRCVFGTESECTAFRDAAIGLGLAPGPRPESTTQQGVSCQPWVNCSPRLDEMSVGQIEQTPNEVIGALDSTSLPVSRLSAGQADAYERRGVYGTKAAWLAARDQTRTGEIASDIVLEGQLAATGGVASPLLSLYARGLGGTTPAVAVESRGTVGSNLARQIELAEPQVINGTTVMPQSGPRFIVDPYGNAADLAAGDTLAISPTLMTPALPSGSLSPRVIG